jgi:hypothetical protein
LFAGSKSGGASDTDGTTAALQSAGFTAVRVLGDREGYRFVEGFRPR